MPYVQVDMENNADQWWAALDEQEPQLAARLRYDSNEGGRLKITTAELKRLQALPGWSNGPEWAPTALIVWEKRQD